MNNIREDLVLMLDRVKYAKAEYDIVTLNSKNQFDTSEKSKNILLGKLNRNRYRASKEFTSCVSQRGKCFYSEQNVGSKDKMENIPEVNEL